MEVPTVIVVVSLISVILTANESGGATLADTQKLRNLMRSKKLLIPFEEVDGTGDENHKELRQKMFDISFQTGTYPQLFVKDGEEYEYIGIWEEINEAMEMQAMLDDKDTLEMIKGNDEAKEKMLEVKMAKIWTQAKKLG